MRLVILVALLGVACGIPVASKKQRAEQRLRALVSRMLQDKEPSHSDLHEKRVTGADAAAASGVAVCPSYVSLAGNDAGRLQVDDVYCDKNCRAGFCPKDKCRCSTDQEPESRSGLVGFTEDACSKYVSLTGNDGGRLQVDDAWCDGNCRGRFLSCPKDKCRCLTDPAASKEKLVTPSAAPLAASEDEALAGNCPKFVGLGGAHDGNPNKRWSGSKEDECESTPLELERHSICTSPDPACALSLRSDCEKNCRKGFCPETKCRCSTDPEPEPSDESAQAAIAQLPVAPVAPTPIAVAPLVAPVAPVAPAETVIAGNCEKFVGLEIVANTWAPKRHEPGHTNTKIKKVDDEYCEKNCRKGFCPEEKCRCITDPAPVPEESEDDAAAKRMAADPHATPKDDAMVVVSAAPKDDAAPKVDAAPTDDCPSYVSNLSPTAEQKGPFKRADDEYCEKNCRLGFCPEASCRCSTEPAPERVAADEAGGSSPEQPVKWWKNKRDTPPTAAGKKSDVTGDEFADDGADWEPKAGQRDSLGSSDDSWLEGAEVYEEGTSDGPMQ